MDASNWNKKPLEVLKIKLMLSALQEIMFPHVINEER